MYSKLAFRNIRRSLRDYIIYFVTLTLTAALMYSFLALGFSPDILAMTENMSMLTTGILILSVLIAFMSSFVIGYGVITILLFCAIYLTYFGATMFLFKKVILRPEMRYGKWFFF